MWPFGSGALEVPSGGGGGSGGRAAASSVLSCVLLALAIGVLLEQLVLAAVQGVRRWAVRPAHWLELAGGGVLPVACVAALAAAHVPENVRHVAALAAVTVLALAARVAAAVPPLSAAASLVADRLLLVGRQMR